MLDIQFKRNSSLQKFLSEQRTDFPIQTKSPEEKVKLLIVRDLLRLGWEMNFKVNRVLIKPPESYDKQIIKDSMQIKRQESLTKHAAWISEHLDLARQNLADGAWVWESSIEPVVEVCETQTQLDVFRIFRFFWSSPYSEYVGRRIKLLIRDNALPSKPLIGIAALGSSIVHIPDRDKWVGWDKETRTRNLIYAMDAYVLGALPPYNYLLGGKLVSYIIASNEVRDIYERKYKGKVTNISKRIANRLACIFTTSLYGKSSQYNRIKYDDKFLYVPIGRTKGYGTLHLTNETFNAMRDLLESRDISVTNRFGDGPIWRMRVIRTAADILGFDADFLLKHSFQRNIYAVPLAHNSVEFLKGEHSKLRYYNYPLDELVGYWKERWLKNRKTSSEIRNSVHGFRAKDFSIV
jgi:Domain of unknown function (DUF4338)